MSHVVKNMDFVSTSALAVSWDKIEEGWNYVTLAWNDPVNEYVLEMEPPIVTFDTSVLSVDGTTAATEFILENAERNKRYCFKVAAKNIYGQGEFSE
jgi:hypothetical protein